MKYLFLVNLIILILFFSCNSNSNNSEEETSEEITESTETSNENKLDFNSAEGFLNSFIDARKKQLLNSNVNTELSVVGKVLLNDFIVIIQITENTGISESEYCIAVGVSNPLNYQIGDKYDDIVTLLNKQGKEYSLLNGYMIKTLDFDNDGKPELLLKTVSGYRTTVSATQTIWFIANRTELKQSNIIANTEAEIGICDGPIGFVENMLVDESKKQIRIERTEGKTNGDYEDCSNYTKETSEKTYYWDKDLQEFTELNSPYNLKDILESFNNNEYVPLKFYSIFNIKDEYKYEHTENSEPIKHRILFKPKKIDDYYILAISEFSNKMKDLNLNTKSSFLFFCINEDSIISKISFDIYDGLKTKPKFVVLNDSLIKVSSDWEEMNDMYDYTGRTFTDAHFITIKDNGELNIIPIESSKYSYKYEILAKHGYKFKEDAYREHYKKFDWYKPLYDNVDSLLTNTDKEILKYLEKLSKQYDQERTDDDDHDY